MSVDAAGSSHWRLNWNYAGSLESCRRWPWESHEWGKFIRAKSQHLDLASGCKWQFPTNMNGMEWNGFTHFFVTHLTSQNWCRIMKQTAFYHLTTTKAHQQETDSKWNWKNFRKGILTTVLSSLYIWILINLIFPNVSDFSSSTVQPPFPLWIGTTSHHSLQVTVAMMTKSLVNILLATRSNFCIETRYKTVSFRLNLHIG